MIRYLAYLLAIKPFRSSTSPQYSPYTILIWVTADLDTLRQ
jgi:hypothetical protein